MITAKDIALKILALPEEQQNVPLVFSHYDDPESSVPCESQLESIHFYETGFPVNGPHLEIS
jgi:hypothetical protein